MSESEQREPKTGRRGWRVLNLDGDHVATSYADQYTLEELEEQWPEGYTFVEHTTETSNRW